MLKQFSYIIKVAEVKNITRAAQELYISQPSLSNYITKLEEDLGVKLFNRTSPLSLTYAGEKYVEAGKQILAINDAIAKDLVAISNFKKGKITIGIPRSRAYYMLPEVLVEFNKRYPDIIIDTYEGSSSEIEEKLLRGELNFAIIPVNNSLCNDELTFKTICEESLILITAKNYLDKAMYNDKTIVWDNLKSTPFILLVKGHSIRQTIDNFFNSKNYKPNIFLETTSNLTAYRLTAKGMGVSIVPNYIVKFLNTDDKVDVYNLAKPQIKWDVCFVYRKKDSLNAVEEYFYETAKSIFS